MVEKPAELDQRLVEATERLGDAARAMLRRAATAERLSPTQAQLLLRITSPSAPEQGTGSLADWLEVSAPTVSDALAALAAKGLVERAHAGPRRVWTATPSGRRAATRLAAWRNPLLAALRDRPTRAKADTLAELLNVIAQLNAGGFISTARTCLTCQFFRPRGPDDPWCLLLQRPLAPAALRVDCAEHVPARPAPG